VDDRLAAQAAGRAFRTSVATLRWPAPDARRVALSGRPVDRGRLIFSPEPQLVVVATGLTPPPDGQEYSCWVEQGGQRQRVGKMFFSNDLAYWVGPAPAVAGLLSDATFGVSLIDLGGTAVDRDPVLNGGL
jgi:hypothetical protein